VTQTPHVISCDKEDCIVCHSWLVEQRELWQVVWFYVQQQDRENHTLQDY